MMHSQRNIKLPETAV